MSTSADGLIDELAAALRAHAEAAFSDGEPAVIFQAADAVSRSARQYGDWLVENGGWYNPLTDIDDDDEGEGVDDGDDGVRVTTISVRARYDYEVPNELSLIAAAQELREQTDPDAPAVVHVGEAVYALTYGKGFTIPALEIPQLVGLNGLTLIHQTTAPLDSSAMNGPDTDIERALLPDSDTDELIYSIGDQRVY